MHITIYYEQPFNIRCQICIVWLFLIVNCNFRVAKPFQANVEAWFPFLILGQRLLIQFHHSYFPPFCHNIATMKEIIITSYISLSAWYVLYSNHKQLSALYFKGGRRKRRPCDYKRRGKPCKFCMTKIIPILPSYESFFCACVLWPLIWPFHTSL